MCDEYEYVLGIGTGVAAPLDPPSHDTCSSVMPLDLSRAGHTRNWKRLSNMQHGQAPSTGLADDALAPIHSLLPMHCLYYQSIPLYPFIHLFSFLPSIYPFVSLLSSLPFVCFPLSRSSVFLSPHTILSQLATHSRLCTTHTSIHTCVYHTRACSTHRCVYKYKG